MALWKLRPYQDKAVQTLVQLTRSKQFLLLQAATGAGKTLVLVCYSGASYAQAGTNILSEMGADMDSVKTLEGGMKAWGDSDLEQ